MRVMLLLKQELLALDFEEAGLHPLLVKKSLAIPLLALKIMLQRLKRM